MEFLSNGYVNSGMFEEMLQKALKKKGFRYIIVKKSSGQRGRLGGGFSCEFFGTNSLKEVVNRESFEEGVEIYDTKTKQKVEREEIAKQYVDSMLPQEKTALIDEMLIQYLVKD